MANPGAVAIAGALYVGAVAATNVVWVGNVAAGTTVFDLGDLVLNPGDVLRGLAVGAGNLLTFTVSGFLLLLP